MKFLIAIVAFFLSVECRRVQNFFNDSRLNPLNVHLVVLNQSYVAKKQVNLKIGNTFGLDGYSNVTEVETGKLYFKLSGPFHKGSKVDNRVLIGLDGKPICNLETNFTMLLRQYLYARNDSSVRIFRIARKVAFRTKLNFDIYNLHGGNRSRTNVYLVRDRKNDGARITIDVDQDLPSLIGRVKFGKVHHELHKSELIVSVGEGIDTAFMVMAAAAFSSTLQRFTLPRYEKSIN